MKEIMSVGARLSIFVFRRYYQPCRTHRCRKIRNSAAQSRLRSSAQGLLFLLCALHPLISLNTEASGAKYGIFSCKSMCIDIYRRQLRWSSLSVNWSVIRMQFFLQAQSSVRKPSDWACKHLIEWSAAVFAGHGASSNDCSVIQLGRVLSQIRPSCIRNHQNIQFWMTVRSLLGYFRPELSVKASLLGKVIWQVLDHGTEVLQYCTSYYH